MPPMPPAAIPTRSRLKLPLEASQPQGGLPSQSMFPALTVQPGMSVLPTGMLNVFVHVPLLPPISKLPFWNGAADTAPQSNSKNSADASLIIPSPPVDAASECDSRRKKSPGLQTLATTARNSITRSARARPTTRRERGDYPVPGD